MGLPWGPGAHFGLFWEDLGRQVGPKNGANMFKKSIQTLHAGEVPPL